LFKIARSYFEKHSDVFRRVYLLGPHGEHVSDSFTKEKPLRINGVYAAEFRCLLKAMVHEWVSIKVSFTYADEKDKGILRTLKMI
jgi:hypothetical protein